MIDIHFKGHTLTGAVATRFWSHVDIRGHDECWPWQGSQRASYGLFRVASGRLAVFGANQVAFALATGRAAKHDVLHYCDNPPCCNPGHLWDGTKVENMSDCAAKRRNRTPRPGNGHRKIDGAASRRIHDLHVQGMNFCAIARAFKITAPTARAHFRRHA